MSDMVFPEGIRVQEPGENAPDFIRCRVGIKLDEFTEWLSRQHGPWVNLEIREARSGKLYFCVDDWQPSKRKAQEAEAKDDDEGAKDADDDLLF